MTIELWWLGKTKDNYLQPGIDEYEKRIKYFNRFLIKEFNFGKAKRVEDQVDLHDQLYLKQMDPKNLVILLDENGDQMNSENFSRFCEKVMVEPANKIVFLIGGPHGFGGAIRKRANYVIALSAMTYTHDMVRLIFLEQLYRAFTISNNLPYHH